MKWKYLIWVFLCYNLSKAHLLTINYTLNEDNLAWNRYHLYPVLDSSSEVMQNRSFCLAFYPLRKAFGVFARTADLEPVMLWDSGATVSWGSTFVLDSTGSLVLRDGSDSNKKVWSAGPSIERWEMERNGNLVLYDRNETAVWQSIDHSSDVVVLGQNFTKLSKGNSSVMIENGDLTVNQGDKTLCRIYIGGLTAGLRLSYDVISGHYSLKLTSFNSSGMQTLTFITIYSNSIYSANDFMFISLQENGSFNLYSLLSGNWTTEFLCCTADQYFDTCQNSGGVLTAGDICLICILIASLFLMIYSEVRSSFYANYRHHILLHMLLLASVAAILLSSLSALIGLFQLKDLASYFVMVSIDMTILQVSVRGVLQFLARNSPPRRRLLFILIALHFIVISLGCSASVVWFLFTDSLSFIYIYILYFGVLNLYPLPIFNTIILVVARLPCCSRRNSNSNRCCILIGLIFANIILAAATIAGSSFSFIYYGSSYFLFTSYYIYSMQSLNSILIAISVWACFAHSVISVQPVMSKIHMMQKRVHIWLLSRLLGKPEPPGEDDIIISLSSYSYPEMEVVTDHFGKQIGRGGFGGVYEGVLLDGRKVAVKKLESSCQGRQEFKSEIETLGKLHHVNLVQLLGFCAEGTHKLLIYEFMSNGSLDKWICNGDYVLDWPQRMKIILGTAQGLAYLHQECNPRILHLDVKPQNILLDETFTAKVADFGLCKLMPADETSLILTRMMGTFGYLAPEWVNGSVSEKNDVYSFGIVVLEVVSGRRSYSSMAMNEEISFLNWASQRCEEGTFLDSRLVKEDCDELQLKRVIDVAFWCACQDANMRPSMGMVVKMLEGNNDYTLPLEQVAYPINQQSSLYSIGEEWSQEVSLTLYPI